MASNEVRPPGPGLWERDPSHLSYPFSRAMAEVILPAQGEGFAEGFARYGVLLDRFDLADVDGWLYTRPRPVAAPEKPASTPPRFVFALLLKLHPALRRRHAAARAAIAGELWRRDCEEWLGRGRPAAREKLLALQRRDAAALDDASLAQLVSEAHAALKDGLRLHFVHAVAHLVGVGDWLAHVAEWTGTSPDEAMPLLRGASPFSAETRSYLRRIAAALRASPAALRALESGNAAVEKVQQLRQASPAVAVAIDAYLDEYGKQVTGFDIDTPALQEMPESLLATITSELTATDDSAVDDESSLRARVPSHRLDEYDRLLETARLAYELRDSDAGPLAHWPAGLLRAAYLEGSRRLVERGLLQQPDHVFEAPRNELVALLLGAARTPSADELAQRKAARERSALNPPPLRLGRSEGKPPPVEWLPPALARISAATGFGMAALFGSPPKAADTGAIATSVRGIAASAGTAEGTARVVSGPADFNRLQEGDILVAAFTTPAYNVVLPLLRGIVTDHGGILSHAAIVAREFGIPAVVATGNATGAIADGARVRIDGMAGVVEVLNPAAV